MLGKMARLPVVPVPGNLPLEPVDTTDFADYLVESVGNGPAGRLADFGGPEVLRFDRVFEQWRQIRRRRVRAVSVPLPSFAKNAAAAMSLTDAESRRGTVTWADWLNTHDPE